jgi:hypothetical protein
LSFEEPWLLCWWPEISEERHGGSCVYYKVLVICYSLLPEDARHGYDLLQCWFLFFFSFFWYYSPWRTSVSSSIVLWFTSPCPQVHVLEILPVLMLSFERPHYVCSVGSADNIVAFTPKNYKKFLGTGFKFSQTTEHKNEAAGLLGCYVLLNGKQLHRPFLHKCNVDRKQRKTHI